MLEEEIVKLKSSVIELTAVMLQIKNLMLTPKEERKKTDVNNEVETDSTTIPEEITLQGLQDLCLGLIRKDPAKNKAIKNIVTSFNAELLKDIHENKWPELKAKLEAL